MGEFISGNPEVLEIDKKIPASRQGGHPEHNLILTPSTIKYIVFGKESQAFFGIVFFGIAFFGIFPIFRKSFIHTQSKSR